MWKCVFVCVCQDLVGKYSQQMVKGMLQLLSNCPPETAHLRKELLIAAKHILTTDLRSRESPFAKRFAVKTRKTSAVVDAEASTVNYAALIRNGCILFEHRLSINSIREKNLIHSAKSLVLWRRLNESMRNSLLRHGIDVSHGSWGFSPLWWASESAAASDGICLCCRIHSMHGQAFWWIDTHWIWIHCERDAKVRTWINPTHVFEAHAGVNKLNTVSWILSPCRCVLKFWLKRQQNMLRFWIDVSFVVPPLQCSLLLEATILFFPSFCAKAIGN